ncbi:MAG: hypothetical protein AAGE52_29940 [Myxococcota bacterium]
MTYDDALAAFHETNPEFTDYGTDRLSNHGPMAAHALHALGLESSIGAFTARYLTRLRPYEDDQGAIAFVEDYAAAIEREGWQPVLLRALEELVWGVSAGALHGVIRTTHAVRGLMEASTPIRRRELSHALSYWKARHVRLPGTVGAAPAIPLARFLRNVPLVVDRVDGLIIDRMLRVETLPAFANYLGSARLPASFEETTTLLTTFAAERICETADPRARFAYLHAFTGSSCLRILGALVPAGSLRRDLERSVVQAIAALDAVTRETTPTPWEGRVHSIDELRAHAADCDAPGYDHHIKIIEAVLREHAASPRPVLLRAASCLIS